MFNSGDQKQGIPLKTDRSDVENDKEWRPGAQADGQATGTNAFQDSIADMATLPLEEQAHLMFSTIAHAAMECMTEATVLLVRDEEPPEPHQPRPRSRQPRVRDTRRYAELHHLARLSEAGSRLLDAHTRLNSQKCQLQYVHRKRQQDGSFVETRLVHRASALTAALALEAGKEEAPPPSSARN